MTRIQSFALGEWSTGRGAGTPLHDAVTGEQIAEASSDGLDFAAMLEYGRESAGRALRRLTFHQRARMLKALALYLTERKESFYRVSAFTGATFCFDCIEALPFNGWLVAGIVKCCPATRGHSRIGEASLVVMCFTRIEPSLYFD